MNDGEILAEVRALAKGLGVELDALDSMSATALVVSIEDRFRVCLPDDELAGVRSVDDLVGVVARRLAC